MFVRDGILWYRKPRPLSPRYLSGRLRTVIGRETLRMGRFSFSPPAAASPCVSVCPDRVNSGRGFFYK